MRSALRVCGLFAAAALTVTLSGCGENNEASVLTTQGTTKVEASGPPVNSVGDYAKRQQSKGDPFAAEGYRKTQAKKK